MASPLPNHSALAFLLRQALHLVALTWAVVGHAPAAAQVIAQLTDNVYFYKADADTMNQKGDAACRFRQGSYEDLVIRIGQTVGETTKAVMDVSEFAIFGSGRFCSPGWAAKETRELSFLPGGVLHWVVTAATDTSSIGHRMRDGAWEVLNGGRNLVLHFHGYPRDNKHVFQLRGELRLASAPAPPPPPPPRYLAPARAPDLMLQCRPVSVANLSTQTNVNRSQDNQQSGLSVQGSCQSTGWENERRSVSIWIAEGRCNGLICKIEEHAISFEGVQIDRFSGQYRDACFVYTCERGQAAGKRF